jgi:hypothetical protein
MPASSVGWSPRHSSFFRRSTRELPECLDDYIAETNFRKGNGKAIRGVCRQFVVLCQQLGLFSEDLVAVDGSRFKAVNERDRNFTGAKLQRRMEELASSINRYLARLDAADRQEPAVAQAKGERLERKIAALEAQMKALQETEVQLDEAPDKQLSLTDPDARSLASEPSSPGPRRPMPRWRAASARRTSSTIPTPTTTVARLDNVWSGATPLSRTGQSCTATGVRIARGAH